MLAIGVIICLVAGGFAVVQTVRTITNYGAEYDVSDGMFYVHILLILMFWLVFSAGVVICL